MDIFIYIICWCVRLYAGDICKLQVTLIQARKILRVAYSRRQNVKTKLE